MSFSLGRVCLGAMLATSCAKAPSGKIWTQFSGDQALAHVQRLVDFGPRTPGSEAIEKSRAYIKRALQSSGWSVSEQAFTENTPRGQVRFVNLIARFGAGGKANKLFLLCSHYDTKIFDTFRFVGANDAGSSTGLLLELARVLAQQPDLAEKIELVFFAGEEALENFSDPDGTYGGPPFAPELRKSGRAHSIQGAIFFAMVGDARFDIP